jgi:hypothetical protein
MPTTRVMLTVLPHSAESNANFHLSLFFSHRLEGGGKLSDYKPMVNWVTTLKNATFSLRVKNSLNPIPCTLKRDVALESAWPIAFPGTTEVRDYPIPKVAEKDWNTFPANKMPEHALAVHYASALSSPVTRPSVLDSPIARAVFKALEGVREAANLIDDLGEYDRVRCKRREYLAQQRNDEANRALNPETPEAQYPFRTPTITTYEPGEGSDVAALGPYEPWKSPIELLLDQKNVDTKITDYLDDLLGPNAPTVLDPMQVTLRDVHNAHRYYFREEEQTAPATLDALQQTDRPPPDFHERVAAVCNVPALARVLGLVVDVTVVNQSDLDLLRQAKQVWCDVTYHNATDLEKYRSPVTLCDGTRFLADPADGNRWQGGRMRVGRADHFQVMDLDPDAAGLALEQHLRGTIRSLAIALNGDRGSYAPAGLRATGFAVAEIARKDRLQPQVAISETWKPAVETSDPNQERRSLNFESLLRGLRVEVWDDVTGRWHSLHERTVTASFKDTGNPQQIFNDRDDPGMLQNPPLSRTPGNDHPYYVHEVLAGWDGWSLSAPRPGKLIIHQEGGADRDTERLADEPEAPSYPGILVQSTAKPKTLPALRYGRKYSFRIVGVDLAGNSVPMDQTPPQAVSAALISAAAKHLGELRANAIERENTGLLESLRASGEFNIVVPPTCTSDPRADVELATASILAHASSLTMHPELDVDPQLLAQLSAGAEVPDTVSAPRRFMRWDPIPAPTLVPRAAYTPGESLQRMVIRTGLTGQPGLCQRHIVPPKGSELEAEQDGRLDDLMLGGNHARGYATALKERGNLFHTRIQDLNNPNGTLPQPGMALISMPGASPPLMTLEQIQDSRFPPSEGQYIVHNVDQMVLPYLPDPMAHGVALVFYEAGADHQSTNPRVLQSVFIPYDGTWPELQPLRLVLHSAPRLDAKQDGNVINVGLPPGEQVAVTFSTTLDQEHLEKMGLWTQHPVHDPDVPEADREVLREAARNGWLWWLTPDADLRLVHATARPAVRPRIARLAARFRNPGVVPAALDGVLDVHGASTDKVELRAQWTEPVDDPKADAPTERTTAEVVVDYRIDEQERLSLLTFDPPGNGSAKTVLSRSVAEPIRTAVHNLPDTKARRVKYRLHGSSRYREFFAANELPPIDDAASAGNEVEVNIPSSAPPAPPVVHDVIPMFLWEQTTEPEHPFATRRVRRSGVRI